MIQKKRGNCPDRKEYGSECSNKIFNVDKIEFDIMSIRTYKVARINKPLLRHDVFLIVSFLLFLNLKSALRRL